MQKYDTDFLKKSFSMRNGDTYKITLDELFNNIVIIKNGIQKNIRFIDKPLDLKNDFIFKVFKKYIQIDKDKFKKTMFDDDFYDKFFIAFYDKF